VLAWLAGQDDLVAMFTEGRDVYSEFASKIYKRTITKADPVERFVGKTCILGLGYGTGATKLQHTLKTQPPGAIIDDDMAKSIVNLYREENDKIPKLWKECDTYLENLISWPVEEDDHEPIADYSIGKHKCVTATPEGILLPSDFYIRYSGIHKNTKDTKTQVVYKSRKGPVSIWGGGVVENIVQALARCVVGEQMLKIGERYRPALTVHDAVVCVVPDDEVEEATEFIVQCMKTPPDWATGLPVACEAKYGKSYGDC
jgi:DNA polymerase